MKKYVLFLIAAVFSLTANADVPERKMLEQGKIWYYAYHHFEWIGDPESEDDDYDEYIWMSWYRLEGDTVIDGRQYMKMYRSDEQDFKKYYFGAFREDEEGRVYMYDYQGDKKDYLVLDFTMQYNGEIPNVTRIAETIKEGNQLFRRYRYQNTYPDGRTYDMGYIGVEGVGIQEIGIKFGGFMLDPFAPDVDCICDYEELIVVESDNFSFDASAFYAPKEIELTDDERQLIESNNDFAFNIFRETRGGESNVISPLSITYALGMLNNGAAGQTQQEINQTLGFGEAGADGINAFCQKMLTEANTLDDKTKALISNTIFVNEGKGYRLQEDFTKKANEFYNAQPQSRNFYDGETMDVINQWANDHTEGMIPTVLDNRTFRPESVSYLLNALYFKGMWSDPFDVAKTQEEAFGGGPNVPMMHKYAEFNYTENNLYQAIVLPYGNGAYQMTVFLPREDKTIADVLGTLNGKNWKIRGYAYDVDLKLPRFETESNINLIGPMSKLGMPTAFTTAAEFPYFCNGSEIFIGNMFQVAKIKLDERGTEAVAVTVIDMPTGMPRTAKFHATRPFLYIISEQSTGAIFFIGQYTGNVTTGETNGIGSIVNGKSSNSKSIYDLSGRRVVNPKRGLYIQGGKRVLIE